MTLTTALPSQCMESLRMNFLIPYQAVLAKYVNLNSLCAI